MSERGPPPKRSVNVEMGNAGRWSNFRSSAPPARWVRVPSTTWLTAPPRKLTRRPKRFEPVLWIVPANSARAPTLPSKLPIRVPVPHELAPIAASVHSDAPGAPAAVNPAGSVSVKRLMAVSVQGCEMVAVSAGELPAVAGKTETVRSGKNAAWAGVAVNAHSTTASRRVRAFTMDHLRIGK